MFYIDFGNLPMIPSIWVVNLHDRKTVFCVFSTFTELNEVKLSWGFRGVNISSKEASGAFGSHQMGRKGQKDPGGAPRQGG
jgi:hypothetical protein